MAFYLGCPVWGQKTWVGGFFPKGTKPKEFLGTYSRRLSTVEGNTTFYALPDAATVERWRDEVPDGFKFCLKVPQTISHNMRLVGAENETNALVDRLRRLREKGGPTLLQLPPTFSLRHFTVLEAYLKVWPSDLRLAVEPRHRDYFAEQGRAMLDDLLLSLNMARCEFDTRGLRSASPTETTATGISAREAQERKPNFAPAFTCLSSLAFVRYCGHPHVEANQIWLAEWAAHIADWLRIGTHVYFFCHHPDDTFAPEVARMLHCLVQAHIKIPSLPQWGEAESSAQLALF
jgi:uncharacterized protein YecE (DUF72 family)